MGEHTQDVLIEAGFSAEEIADLAQSGVCCRSAQAEDRAARKPVPNLDERPFRIDEKGYDFRPYRRTKSQMAYVT